MVSVDDDDNNDNVVWAHNGDANSYVVTMSREAMMAMPVMVVALPRVVEVGVAMVVPAWATISELAVVVTTTAANAIVTAMIMFVALAMVSSNCWWWQQ